MLSWKSQEKQGFTTKLQSMWPVGDPKQSLHALSELKALFAAPDAVMTLQDATEADWQAAMRRFAENEQAIPAVVAMPASADEVSAVVKYAVLRNIAFAVKCGGHDAAPPQTVGGMVIDLSRLKGVRWAQPWSVERDLPLSFLDSTARSNHMSASALILELLHHHITAQLTPAFPSDPLLGRQESRLHCWGQQVGRCLPCL